MQKQKGNIAETAVIYTLAKLNLPVFKEIGDSVSVDLITIVNKRPVTIQVKYAELNRNNAVQLMLRKTGPNGYVYHYGIEDFDLFALYINDTQQVIWVSSKVLVLNTTSVSFRIDTPKNNQRGKINYVCDYLDLYNALLV